jgi:hypothetical protein
VLGDPAAHIFTGLLDEGSTAAEHPEDGLHAHLRSRRDLLQSEVVHQALPEQNPMLVSAWATRG